MIKMDFLNILTGRLSGLDLQFSTDPPEGWLLITETSTSFLLKDLAEKNFSQN